MKSFVMSAALLVTTLSAHGASAVDEDLPWKAGMSPEQVRAITAFGPYSAFSNG